MASGDPNPSVEFLRSGPTLSYDIFVFRFYEAAVGDLRQSARSGRRSSLHNAVIEAIWMYAIRLGFGVPLRTIFG